MELPGRRMEIDETKMGFIKVKRDMQRVWHDRGYWSWEVKWRKII